MYVPDIPSSEMVTILELRCGCPPSHAKQLVAIMESLRQRRSRSGVFLGKDGFITPRDLLRWAERGCLSKADLAREGFMLLAERLRTEEEKECVKFEIEKHLKVEIKLESYYYGESSDARVLLEKVQAKAGDLGLDSLVKSLAPTRSILRLITLVLRCIEQREPVLLVGGK
jgi:midasin